MVFKSRNPLEIVIIEEGNEPLRFKALVGILKPGEKSTTFRDVGYPFGTVSDEKWSKTDQKNVVLSYIRAGYKSSLFHSQTCDFCGKPVENRWQRSPDYKWRYLSNYPHYISSHCVKPPLELITDAFNWSKNENAKVKRIYVEDGRTN